MSKRGHATRILDFVSAERLAALVLPLAAGLTFGTLVALATLHWGNDLILWQLVWWSFVSAVLGVITFRIADPIFRYQPLYLLPEGYLVRLIGKVKSGFAVGGVAILAGLIASVKVMIDGRVASAPVELYWPLPIGIFIFTAFGPIITKLSDARENLKRTREQEEFKERKRAKRCAEVTSLQRIEFEDQFLLAVYSTTDGDTKRIELGEVWSRLNHECAPELTIHAINVWRERKCINVGDKFNVHVKSRLSLTATGRDLCMRAIRLGSMQKAIGERQRAGDHVMGDKYEVSGQAGAVGRGAHAHDMSFQQIWASHASEIDLPQLAVELETLRQALRKQAITREHDIAVAEIGAAAEEAERGNGPGALHRLKGAGQWALNAATSIGTTVAAAAIRAAMGI